jgi:hypothetical protein
MTVGIGVVSVGPQLAEVLIGITAQQNFTFFDNI